MNAGTLILAGADGNGNALTVTGGLIASPLRLSSTGTSNIRFAAPTGALLPTAATAGGPYQTTISGVVDLNSTLTALTRTFTVEDGPAPIDLTFTGALTSSGAATGLTKAGAGFMRIGVASTYTGLTTVNAGTLSFNAAASLGFGGLTVTGGAAQFDAANAVNTLPTTLTIPTLAPVTVTVTGGTLEFNNIAQTFGKLVYAGGTINAPLSTTLTLQNPLNNATILQLDGTNGLVTLRGNLSLGAALVGNNVTTLASSTSTVTIDGVLNLNAAGAASTRTFDIGDGSAAIDLDVPAALINTNATNLIKAGLGTMRLSGGLLSQNLNSGAVIVNAGTLVLAKQGVFNALGGVAISSGALLIGDNFANPATVRLDADEQIANAAVVTINPGGVLSMQTFSENLGTVNILSTGNTGGSITGSTGSLYTGILNMTGGSIGPGERPDLHRRRDHGDQRRLDQLGDDQRRAQPRASDHDLHRQPGSGRSDAAGAGFGNHRGDLRQRAQPDQGRGGHAAAFRRGDVHRRHYHHCRHAEARGARLAGAQLAGGDQQRHHGHRHPDLRHQYRRPVDRFAERRQRGGTLCDRLGERSARTR